MPQRLPPAPAFNAIHLGKILLRSSKSSKADTVYGHIALGECTSREPNASTQSQAHLKSSAQSYLLPRGKDLGASLTRISLASGVCRCLRELLATYLAWHRGHGNSIPATSSNLPWSLGVMIRPDREEGIFIKRVYRADRCSSCWLRVRKRLTKDRAFQVSRGMEDHL